jgi:hypothetical protein
MKGLSSMMRRLLGTCLIAVVVGCASTTTTTSLRSRAVVRVTAITPPAASRLSTDTTLDATASYRIEDFKGEPDRYYLTIQFEKVGGGSFNHYKRFADEPMLSTADGVVHVSYPMSKVWNDERLKRPVRVWFYLIERTAAHESAIIGEAGPFEYAAE